MHSLLHDNSPTRLLHLSPVMNIHYHPESIVYITSCSWCCTFCGFGQMNNDLCLSLWYHTEDFHCPKNPLCFTCVSFTSPTPSSSQSLVFLLALSVQSLSHVQLCATPWTAAPGFPVHRQLQELAQTHVHQVGDAIQPSHPLLLLASIFPSIRVFSYESVLCIRWPKYWSFTFSISPSNEYSGLISFRIDWLDLLAVQGTLKSLQHHISKASIIWGSDFFMVQLSHPYMTTGKPIALTRWNFVGKVTSLLFNMLSRLVIDFLPRSKHHLISWLKSPSAVILEPKKVICHCFHCVPIYLP